MKSPLTLPVSHSSLFYSKVQSILILLQVAHSYWWCLYALLFSWHQQETVLLLLANKIFKELYLEREFLPENTRSHFPLAASPLLLPNPVQLPEQMCFSLFTSCLPCLPSSSAWHSSGHHSVPFPLSQITQKRCAFYQQRKINTFGLWFFSWLAKYISAVAPDGLYIAGGKSNHSCTEFLSIMIPSSNTFPVFWEFSMFSGKVNKSCNSHECSIFDGSQGYQINGQCSDSWKYRARKGKSHTPWENV